MSDSLKPHKHSLPGSSVHGILQARILEWVAIPFFRGSSQSREILYHRSHQGSLDFKVYTYPNQILINLLFLKHGCLYKNSSTETLEPECFLNVGDHYSLIYAWFIRNPHPTRMGSSSNNSPEAVFCSWPFSDRVLGKSHDTIVFGTRQYLHSSKVGNI